MNAEASTDHLIQKPCGVVFSQEELQHAFDGIASGKQPGIDGLTKEAYAINLEPKLRALAESLAAGTYSMEPVQRFWMPKPGGGLRPGALVCIEDKLVQRALLHRIEARYMDKFSERSFCRSGWGRMAAADQLFLDLMELHPSSVLKLDIKKFFENINHDKLDSILAARLSESERELVRQWLGCAVIIPGAEDATEATLEVRKVGLEQGMPISNLLANIYLDAALDPWLDAQLGTDGAWVRYLDDIIVCLSGDGDELADAVDARLGGFGLSLNRDKTQHAAGFSEAAVEMITLGDHDPFGGIHFVGISFCPARTSNGSYFVRTFDIKSAVQEDADATSVDG